MDLSIQTAALIDRERPFVNPWEDIRNHTPIVDFNNCAIKGKLEEELLESFVWGPMSNGLSKVVQLMSNHMVISTIWLVSVCMTGAMAHAMLLVLLITSTWFLPPYLEVVRSVEGIGNQLKY